MSIIYGLFAENTGPAMPSTNSRTAHTAEVRISGHSVKERNEGVFEQALQCFGTQVRCLRRSLPVRRENLALDLSSVQLGSCGRPVGSCYPLDEPLPWCGELCPCPESTFHHQLGVGHRV